MPYSHARAIIVSMLLQVKLWDIPDDGISGSLSSPTATFGPMEVRWGGRGRGKGGGGGKGGRGARGGRRGYVSPYLPNVVTLCDSCISFSGCLQKRIESLLFHPAADNVRHTHTRAHAHTHTHTYTHTTQIGDFLEQ